MSPSLNNIIATVRLRSLAVHRRETTPDPAAGRANCTRTQPPSRPDPSLWPLYAFIFFIFKHLFISFEPYFFTLLCGWLAFVVNCCRPYQIFTFAFSHIYFLFRLNSIPIVQEDSLSTQLEITGPV